MHRTKLIIQIPCYNEAETLEVALNDLPQELEGIDEIEYLIINDGSQDNTVEVAKRWGVRRASNTDIPDAPSGFRALSRDAAMRINVVNDYTYTLETIVQAGRERMGIIWQLGL